MINKLIDDLTEFVYIIYCKNDLEFSVQQFLRGKIGIFPDDSRAEMKNKVKRYVDMLYIDDVKRIISICLQNGVEITKEAARDLWEHYSNDWMASWLMLPEDDNELWDIVKSYLGKTKGKCPFCGR